jgi:hypothetical protein
LTSCAVPPESDNDAASETNPPKPAQLKECSQIADSISGVDLCFDPSANSPRWIKLEVAGKENAADTTGHFPSGWGIRAELALLNRGTKEAVITSGTKILTFMTKQGEVNVIADGDLTVPARTDDTAGYSIVIAYFDSEVLEDGLSEIPYVVNPDAEIAESNHDNNEGTMKLFHPSAYPDIRVTEVIVPEYVQKLGDSLWDAYEITVKFKNIGGDMTRVTEVQIVINESYKFANLIYLEPLEHGEEFEEIYKFLPNKGVHNAAGDQIPVEVRISDEFNMLIGPYSWASLINTDEPSEVKNNSGIVILAFSQDEDYLASPTEIGSEAVIIGTASTHPDPFGEGSLMDTYGYVLARQQGVGVVGVPTPEDYDGDAVYNAESFTLTLPIPHLIYPHNDQNFSLTDLPPVLPEEWNNCDDEPAKSIEFVGLDNKLTQLWVHRCFGIRDDSYIPDSVRVANWPDSFLRFRWLPLKGIKSYEAQFQIRNANQKLIHEVIWIPEWGENTDMSSTFTGIGIDEFQLWGDPSNPGVGDKKGRSYDDIYDYWLNQSGNENVAKATAEEGGFNQYVYDGPPLEPGDYYWRVTNDVTAEEGSKIWSEEFKFIIEANDLNPGQPLRFMDTDLAPGLAVSGEVVNVYPGGFTLATEQGFVNLRTDTDTIIYSDMTGMHSEVPLGWKADISIDESPYIVGRALVPYGSIPIVNYVLERLWFNYHDMCTVIGQTGPGKIAVSCHSGDYMELNSTDVPADADKIVFIRAYKECEVVEVSPEGPAQLECEDGEPIMLLTTDTLYDPFKKGQVILVSGKSPKLISDAAHLHEHITEFGIVATSMDDQGFTAVLESYGYQLDTGSDAGFEQAMAESSPEVQEYLQTIMLFHGMAADIALSFISADNDFIFDDSDIYTLEQQLEKVVESYEYIVDLMVNEGLHNLSKEHRDEVIAGIKSQSTHLQPWSELKTKLTKAVYFLEQRDLIEFVSVMDGTLKK